MEHGSEGKDVRPFGLKVDVRGVSFLFSSGTVMIIRYHLQSWFSKIVVLYLKQTNKNKNGE